VSGLLQADAAVLLRAAQAGSKNVPSRGAGRDVFEWAGTRLFHADQIFRMVFIPLCDQLIAGPADVFAIKNSAGKSTGMFYLFIWILFFKSAPQIWGVPVGKTGDPCGNLPVRFLYASFTLPVRLLYS